MDISVLRPILKKELLEAKDSNERIEICKKEGFVYLGKGFIISKEDYNKVIIAENAIKYGDNLDED